MAFSKKIIPIFGQNVNALTPERGMEGVLQWLMTERLHKYWPLFSHMTYSTLITLAPDNFDAFLESIDASGVSAGAYKKILNLAQRLRDRASTLEGAHTLTMFELNSYLEWILTTPLADFPEHDGIFLIPKIHETIIREWSTRFVKGKGSSAHDDIDRERFVAILNVFAEHPQIPPEYKTDVVNVLESFKDESLLKLPSYKDLCNMFGEIDESAAATDDEVEMIRRQFREMYEPADLEERRAPSNVGPKVANRSDSTEPGPSKATHSQSGPEPDIAEQEAFNELIRKLNADLKTGGDAESMNASSKPSCSSSNDGTQPESFGLPDAGSKGPASSRKKSRKRSGKK